MHSELEYISELFSFLSPVVLLFINIRAFLVDDEKQVEEAAGNQGKEINELDNFSIRSGLSNG